jgi:HlyD family secretion protein
MKKLGRVVLILLALGGIAGGLYLIFRPGEKERDVLHLYGNVDIRQIQLAFHDNGRIRRLHLEEGDPVKAGQLVAELDPARYEAAMARAQAQLNVEKEVLARLLAGSRPEEISEARARVRAAEATLVDAELEYNRTKTLAHTEYASRQKLDSTEAVLKSARANLQVAQQGLILALKGPREEDIAAARAKVKAYEAALSLTERELADTKLYAPESGIIQYRILEAGDMAFPQTPVYTLALTNPIWVRAYLSEPDLGRIAPGMAAEVYTDSFPGKSYKGWIGFISPTAEFTPKQVETTELRSKLVYRLRVYVCNPQNELRLGMPVSVAISLNQSRKIKNLDRVNPCLEN